MSQDGLISILEYLHLLKINLRYWLTEGDYCVFHDIQGNECLGECFGEEKERKSVVGCRSFIHSLIHIVIKHTC